MKDFVAFPNGRVVISHNRAHSNVLRAHAKRAECFLKRSENDFDPDWECEALYLSMRNKFWKTIFGPKQYLDKLQARAATSPIDLYDRKQRERTGNPFLTFGSRCEESFEKCTKTADIFNHCPTQITTAAYADSSAANIVRHLNYFVRYVKTRMFIKDPPFAVDDAEACCFYLLDADVASVPQIFGTIIENLVRDYMLEDANTILTDASRRRIMLAYEKDIVAKAAPFVRSAALEFAHERVLLFWYLSGMRFDSFVQVEDQHILRVENGHQITVVKDKICKAQNRKVTIACNCGSQYGSRYCFLHNTFLAIPSFPIRAYDLDCILKKYGLTRHSCRRGLALALAQLVSNGQLSLFHEDVNLHFGWQPESEQFHNYTADFRNFINFVYFPAWGVVRGFCRTHGSVVKLSNIKVCPATQKKHSTKAEAQCPAGAIITNPLDLKPPDPMQLVLKQIVENEQELAIYRASRAIKRVPLQTLTNEENKRQKTRQLLDMPSSHSVPDPKPHAPTLEKVVLLPPPPVNKKVTPSLEITRKFTNYPANPFQYPKRNMTQVSDELRKTIEQEKSQFAGCMKIDKALIGVSLCADGIMVKYGREYKSNAISIDHNENVNAGFTCQVCIGEASSPARHAGAIVGGAWTNKNLTCLLAWFHFNQSRMQVICESLTDSLPVHDSSCTRRIP